MRWAALTLSVIIAVVDTGTYFDVDRDVDTDTVIFVFALVVIDAATSRGRTRVAGRADELRLHRRGDRTILKGGRELNEGVG